MLYGIFDKGFLPIQRRVLILIFLENALRLKKGDNKGKPFIKS